MKAMTASVKGIAAVIVAWMTYIDNTFSPLFWVLLVLIFIDLVLNIHKEGQQFSKLGSMALSLGVPTYITSNLGNPELGKYLVAIMCLCYVQLVVPQLLQTAARFRLAKDKTTNKVDAEMIAAIVNQVSNQIDQKARQELQHVGIGAQPTPPKENGGV